LFTQSIDYILPDCFIGELIGNKDNNHKGWKNENIPDTGKKCQVLPDIGKEIKRNMRHGNRETLVKIIHPIIKDKFSHKYSQSEKKKVQTGQDPKNPVCQYFSEFYF
jgi:hypothetical protein